ncbi:MAG: methyltransferase domain-containing protein [Candidatus Aenigmatarchaeota archaeon]
MRIEWENIASIYAKKRWYGKGLFPHEKKMLNEISNFANSIIDVGCGAGRHVRFLKQKNFFVIGLDFSLNMIKEAKKMCNAFYILGDARALPFKDSTVDCCICLGNTIASVGENKNNLLFGASLAIDEMLRVSKRIVVIDFREGRKKYEKRFIEGMPYTTRSWSITTVMKLFRRSKYRKKIREIKIIRNVKVGENKFFYVICFLK